MIESILLLILVFGGGYWTGADHEQGKQAQLELKLEQVAKVARENAAEEIRKIEIKHTTIQNDFKEVVRIEKVYQDCKHSPDAWQLIMKAYQDE